MCIWKKFLLFLMAIVSLQIEVNAMDERIKDVFMDSLVMKLDSPKAYSRTINVSVDYQDENIRPFMENEIVYVPLRFLMEYQSGKIMWLESTNSVLIEIEEKKLQWDGIHLMDGAHEILLNQMPCMRDERWYVPIEEWNEKVLGKQLTLYEDYIIISPKDTIVPDYLYTVLDQYYRKHTWKKGTLLNIRENGMAGTIDVKGNIIIEPKYYFIIAEKDRPILCYMKNRGWDILTEYNELIGHVNTDKYLQWLPGNQELILASNSYIPGQGGKVCVLDLMGDDVEQRINETLIVETTSTIRFSYQNGVKIEEEQLEDGSKKAVLKNISGNVLYESILPDGFQFSTVIQNDELIVLKDGIYWGTADLNGNLVPFSDNHLPPKSTPTPILAPIPTANNGRPLKNGIYIDFNPKDGQRDNYNYRCCSADGTVLWDNGNKYVGWASFEDGIIEFDTDTHTGYMDTDFQPIYIFDKIDRIDPLHLPG